MSETVLRELLLPGGTEAVTLFGVGAAAAWARRADLFAVPFAARCLVGGFLALAVWLDAAVTGAEAWPPEVLQHGFGPLARQPLFIQIAEVLLLGDFIGYWFHRALHRDCFWRMHSGRHSADETAWLLAQELPPVQAIVGRVVSVMPLLMFGFVLPAVLSAVSLVIFALMFVRSDLQAPGGLLRWVFVSPTYHRWHHTSDSEGIDRNFAAIFPLWDLVFGTCSFPAVPNSVALVSSCAVSACAVSACAVDWVPGAVSGARPLP